MKDIIIIGSTGSIGTQTLSICDIYPDKFRVVGLSCGSNIDLFSEQVEKYKPKYIAIADKDKKSRFVNSTNAIMLDSVEELCTINEGSVVVTAVVGIAGLLPTISAIKAGKNIALANKETLVAGGDIVMPLKDKYGVEILPVDSEHSAIWQCLNYNTAKSVKKLILTASGGAFRGKDRDFLSSVKASDALCHPTWNMGRKVTIDSATLMNKGLEMIEAKHLFGVDMDKIEVVCHKESIIHSMVAYNDNSVIAEMSYPDMVLPIQLALTYPEKLESRVANLDFFSLGSLHFEKIDESVFECLSIARECGRLGGIYPIVMNGANEIAVDKFLRDEISFLDIAKYIKLTLDAFSNQKVDSVDTILHYDKLAREKITSLIK